MSTGLNCIILQVATYKWYYILENSNAPRNSWDWREYAGAYGSFTTMQAAEDHLSRFQANPGGHEIRELPDGVDRLHYDEPQHEDFDEVLVELIKNAPKHTRHI